MKRPIRLLLTVLLALSVIGVLVGIARAQTGYTLRYGTFNAASGVVTGPGYQAQVAVGQSVGGLPHQASEQYIFLPLVLRNK